MANNQDPIVHKKLHTNARDKIRNHVKNFLTSLTLQAKLQAFKENADEVLSPHVEEAYITIISRRKETWLKKMSTIIGGCFFGAFIPGFVNALSKGDTLLIITFTIMGFIGMFLVFLGIKP